jgi:hypothetical protein
MNVIEQIKDLMSDFDFHRIEDLKTDSRQAFANLNGWRLTNAEFTTRVLATSKVHAGSGRHWDEGRSADSYQHEFMDHAEFFRESAKPYRAAAIVAHLYNCEADVHSWALERGLHAHVPPRLKASWYYPGATLIVCYTRPHVIVRWLPEQHEPTKSRQ